MGREVHLLFTVWDRDDFSLIVLVRMIENLIERSMVGGHGM
jgi:hypothetical protein